MAEPYWKKDEEPIRPGGRSRRLVWEQAMERGCRVCRASGPGKVCPGCGACLACGTGCVECLPYRRKPVSQ